MKITWKMIVDYGLLLTVLVLGVTLIWFIKGIYTELKSLNQFLSRLVKRDSLTNFLKKK
jgi:hypothetical protein